MSFAPVHFRDGRKSRDIHGTYFLTGKRFGTPFGKVLVIVLADLFPVALAPGDDKVTVIGKKRTVEILAFNIIGADLKTQSALKASSDLVFQFMIFSVSLWYSPI